MATYTVQKIFVGLDSDDLKVIRATAIDALKKGLFVTQWSSGGNSATKEWVMSPVEMLMEANYAIRLAEGRRIRSTQARFS